jgi:hypothetical protein
MANSIAKLKKKLNSVEKKLFALSVEINQSEETSNFYWSQKQREAKKQYEKARVIFSEWSKINIPKVFDLSLRGQIKRIKDLKFKPPKTVNYVQFKDNNINKQSKAILTIDAISDYVIGLDSGLKKYNKLIRATQQTNITEKQLDESLTEGFQEKGSLYGASKRLQQELMKDVLDKKYIVIIDKNGKPRNYGVKSYADMVARTKFIDAQADATVNTAIGFGSDLVQVSSHNTLTPFDAQFEGKIFSLSGKDPDFPPATHLPAYHPNCIHTLSVYFRDAHTPEQVKKASDFSKGKTETHPTRQSHIPVSERA